MTDSKGDVRCVLTLPPAAAEELPRVDPERLKGCLTLSDPPDTPLGSAGGTAHALVTALGMSGDRAPLTEWVRKSRTIVMHGSGESRRLPGYAVAGKPFIPLPRFPDIGPQQLDQVLFDLQMPAYEALLRPAPPCYRVMIACGDVLLRFRSWLPRYPEADVLIVGLLARPEDAQHHGVMFCPRGDPARLEFFLQKPEPKRIRALTGKYIYSLDTGVWLLSERAVGVLLGKAGWDARTEAFADGVPTPYELYSGFGLALGRTPVQPDPEIGALSCAVLALPDGHFYHFGTNRSLFASVSALAMPPADWRSFGHSAMESAPACVIQHSEVHCPLDAVPHVWIESSHLGRNWTLRGRHVLTGIPANDWDLALEPGCCLDVTPLGPDQVCIRAYGFDDTFRGMTGAPDTLWLGQPLTRWLAERGIEAKVAGLDLRADIQHAPLFPVMPPNAMQAGYIQWLLAASPGESPAFREAWIRGPRLSAHELLRTARPAQAWQHRQRFVQTTLDGLTGDSWLAECSHLDLEATARLFRQRKAPLPPPLAPHASRDPIGLIHDRMFRSAVAADRTSPQAEAAQTEAFALLRRSIVSQMETDPVQPSPQLQEDQILWGRSPIRLDIAGGWTDTPPYCLENGGRVVNVAADLNGQPPVQVFARISSKPEIVLRSIDLGITETVRTYDELTTYGELGSGFGIAKAALALAGLEPRFHSGGGHPSLARQLQREFGGGIDLSMLAAVPKGSGLGTSSILAASLLGVMGELCGLRWGQDDLVRRTLALEQMLTSGGGWQDQAGGLVHGIKLIETEPGWAQTPVIRWLPGTFFEPDFANRIILLYYTGLTRVAHDILGEIVRGVFLNSRPHVRLIEDIGRTAQFAADALLRHDWSRFCEAVRRSWTLNQLLDPGTNPAGVQEILNRVGDFAAAAKLLGAGGGGYLLIAAKDAEAGRRIRQALTAQPPNDRARFVSLGLSRTGLQITRS